MIGSAQFPLTVGLSRQALLAEHEFNADAAANVNLPQHVFESADKLLVYR